MLSRCYGRMEAKGLVERVVFSDGERVTHLEIKPKGFKVAKEVAAVTK